MMSIFFFPIFFSCVVVASVCCSSSSRGGERTRVEMRKWPAVCMELCAYWTSERYISLLPPSIHLLLLAGWATRRKRTVQWPRLISHPHSACAHGRCATHRRHPPPKPLFPPIPKGLFLSFFLSVSPAAALALSSLHFLLESTLHVIPIPSLRRVGEFGVFSFSTSALTRFSILLPT